MATLRLILTTTTTWMWSALAQEQSVSTASSSRSRDASSTTLTLKSSQGTFSSTGCWLDSIKVYQSLVYDVLHIFSSSSLSCYLPIFFVKVVIFCYWTTKKKILNFRRCMVVFFYKQLVKAAENEESIFRRADDGFFWASCFTVFPRFDFDFDSQIYFEIQKVFEKRTSVEDYVRLLDERMSFVPIRLTYLTL